MRARARIGPAQVSAEAAGTSGGFYVSGPLTPYDVESLYEQLAGRTTEQARDVRIVVDLAGAPRNSPELRSLASRLKRLERTGVSISMHASRGTRGKLTPRG